MRQINPIVEKILYTPMPVSFWLSILIAIMMLLLYGLYRLI